VYAEELVNNASVRLQAHNHLSNWDISDKIFKALLLVVMEKVGALRVVLKKQTI